jgi:uncharacterized protein involved in oxidation of intracellular sulfur
VGNVRIFLMPDAVLCAERGQKTPEGYYNVERMLRRAISAKGRVLLCGTCVDARGIMEGELVEGSMRSSMDELASLTRRREGDRLLKPTSTPVRPLSRATATRSVARSTFRASGW